MALSGWARAAGVEDSRRWGRGAEKGGSLQFKALPRCPSLVHVVGSPVGGS
jgi:hypothetical protein